MAYANSTHAEQLERKETEMDKIRIARQLVRIARQLVADEDENNKFIEQLGNQEKLDYAASIDAILGAEAKMTGIYNTKTNTMRDYRKELNDFVKSMEESSRKLKDIKGLNETQMNDIEAFSKAVYDFNHSISRTSLDECRDAVQAFQHDFPTDQQMMTWMKKKADEQYDKESKKINGEIEAEFFQHVDRMQKKTGQFSDNDLKEKAQKMSGIIQQLMENHKKQKELLPKAKEKLQKFSDMATSIINKEVSSTGLAGFATTQVKKEIRKALEDTQMEIRK